MLPQRPRPRLIGRGDADRRGPHRIYVAGAAVVSCRAARAALSCGGRRGADRPDGCERGGSPMPGTHARQRMDAVLAESDLDAVIAISPENVFYLSRALIITQRYIPDRLAIVVWPREGEPTCIVCA